MAVGGSWWVLVDIFWLVVGGGGYILAGGGWWHSLVWPTLKKVFTSLYHCSRDQSNSSLTKIKDYKCSNWFCLIILQLKWSFTNINYWSTYQQNNSLTITDVLMSYIETLKIRKLEPHEWKYLNINIVITYICLT